MFVNLVQFGYFVLFGLIQTSIGIALYGETRSDVTLVIEFVNYPLSCNEIYIFFKRFGYSSLERRYYDGESVMTFTNNGVQCLSSISYQYKTRIVNASINFPTHVTFGLRNVSVYDSGWFDAHGMPMKKWYLFNENSGENFGEQILLVGDTILRTCTLRQMEFELVFPLSVLNETVAVVLFSGIHLSRYIISICNPEEDTCSQPPRARFPRFECRMNGSRITISLASVHKEDEGLYAVIGSTSSTIFQSAVLHVIDCVSTTAAFDIEFNTTELPNLTTIYAAVTNNANLYSRVIMTSSAPITDKSLENYFLGGGVVAGVTIVILICWFLWKRCYETRRNGAASDDYNTVDVHYYCSIPNRNDFVLQSEATTGSVPESQQLNYVMD